MKIAFCVAEVWGKTRDGIMANRCFRKEEVRTNEIRKTGERNRLTNSQGGYAAEEREGRKGKRVKNKEKRRLEIEIYDIENDYDGDRATSLSALPLFGGSQPCNEGRSNKNRLLRGRQALSTVAGMRGGGWSEAVGKVEGQGEG